MQCSSRVACATRRLGYVAAFVAAGFLGRATIVDDQALSLVWPAAGIALLWFLGGPRGRWTWVDVALLSLATYAVNAITGSTPAMSLVFVVANVVQVVTIVALTRRLAPEVTGVERLRRIDTPGALARLLLAIALGCAVAVTLGVAGMWLVSGFFSVESTLTWWGRNVCGALAVTTAGILLVRGLFERRAGIARTGLGGPVELGALVAFTATIFLVDLGSTSLPLAFLLPAMTTWAGMRFSTTVATLHALAGGGAAIALTLVGHGPFAAVESIQYSALLSQFFVGMTVVVGLFLGIERDQNVRLQRALTGSQRDEARQKEVLHAIITAMSDGVVVLDAEGRILLSNPAAADLLPGASLTGTADVRLHDLSGTEQVALRDLSRKRRDVRYGDSVLAATATPIADVPGSDGETVLVLHDVTGDRAHEEELASFAGVVAHDLLNPIGAVSAWASLLADELGDTSRDRPGASVRMAERIGATAHRMEALVTDLLADARSRDSRLTIGTVDVSALVRDVASARDVEGHVTVAALPLVQGDTALLRQLVDNLVGNAVKYSRPGVTPEILVEGEQREGQLVLRFTDNGLGIPAGQHDQVFRRFHRAHTDTHPGTGLGLAICASIAERHGGRLRAHPRTDGPGTVFELTLPAAAAALQQPAPVA